MQRVCETCGWRYLARRAQTHLAMHDLLPQWPCLVRSDFGVSLQARDFPLSLAAILVHGLYQLQPDRQVHLLVSRWEWLFYLAAKLPLVRFLYCVNLLMKVISRTRTYT